MDYLKEYYENELHASEEMGWVKFEDLSMAHRLVLRRTIHFQVWAIGKAFRTVGKAFRTVGEALNEELNVKLKK
jgi:hypothetical protein